MAQTAAQTAKPVLKGPRITLRDAEPKDVAARFALGNSVEIQKMFGAEPSQVRPITEHAAEAWVENQRAEPYAWVIENENGALLGAIRIHSVNHADMRANLAVGILNESELGKGYGTEAIRVLAAHAFDTMGLHRLSCRVLAFNTRAVAAYKKLGFVEEGRERQSARIGNTWEDDVIMGLLAQDLERD